MFNRLENSKVKQMFFNRIHAPIPKGNDVQRCVIKGTEHSGCMVNAKQGPGCPMYPKATDAQHRANYRSSSDHTACW